MNILPTNLPGKAAHCCRLAFKTLRMSFSMSGNPITALSTMGWILRKMGDDQRYGDPLNYRQVDGKRYWHPHIPGYPSPAFDRIFHYWIAYNLGQAPDPGLYSAHVAITGTCPLDCDHCSEQDALTQHEPGNEEAILDSIERVIGLGAARISLSGGEPASRLPLVHRILDRFSGRGVQFWINTSAAGLTREQIMALKRHGLTGITFSLDHHDARAHDRFRGREGCHRQVVSAIKSAVELGLVTETSLCAMNDFISEENLNIYLGLVKNLNVTFVQILEPKPVGKLKNRDTALEPGKRKLLESFYHSTLKAGRTTTNHPLISYPDYHNRRYGCEGGKYHIYVDMLGNAFPCPFCRSVSTPLSRLIPSTLSRNLHCPNGAALSA